MKRLWILPLIAIFAVGCAHSQPPATSHSATITITNAPCPAGTPTTTCGYAFYGLTVTGTTCPTPTGQYAQLNTTLIGQPATGSASYQDFTAAGSMKCYTAETVEGTANSAAASPAGPATVLANPTAPTLGTPTVAGNQKPLLPSGNLCDGGCMVHETTSNAPAPTGLKALALNTPALKITVR